MHKVVCVLKTGGCYDSDYVWLLAENLKKQGGKESVQLICLTDLVKKPGRQKGVLFLPLREGWVGRWSKLEIFSPWMKRFRPFVYLDLDTAIVGSVRDILTIGESAGFVMLRDFHIPSRPASGMMFLPNSVDLVDIYKNFKADADGIIDKYERYDRSQDDQHFIYAQVKPNNQPDGLWQELLPDQILSYKPTRKERLKILPDTAAMIFFHGTPRFREAISECGWVKQYWDGGSRTGAVDAVKKELSCASKYPHRHTGTLLIVGSAPCWEEDYEKAKEGCPSPMIMTIGHAAGLVKADFVVTDHYEVMGDLNKLQHKFHDNFSTHCTRCSDWQKYAQDIDYYYDWTRSACTSLETAIRIGIVMGFDEMILCGCPMDAGEIIHPDQIKKDGAIWPPPSTKKLPQTRDSQEKILKGFRSVFVEKMVGWKDCVRSMSGFTRSLLGKPEFEGINAVVERWSGEEGAAKNFVGDVWPNDTMQGLIQSSCGKCRPIVDIGCGVGRCASLFDSEGYIGVDVNPTALAMAKKDNPKHRFDVCNWSGPFPAGHTALFCTVLLHIPDAYIERLIYACRSMKRIVVYESMAHELRDRGFEYQRDPHDYRVLFGKIGLTCTSLVWDKISNEPYFANLMVFEI